MIAGLFRGCGAIGVIVLPGRARADRDAPGQKYRPYREQADDHRRSQDHPCVRRAGAGGSHDSKRSRPGANRREADLCDTCDDNPDRRRRGGISGPPHLLHRAQLCRACDRARLRSDPRAAVLFPEADRRDPEVADRRPSRIIPIPRSPRTITTRSNWWRR